MRYDIAVIKGDGVGPEVVGQAVNILAAAGQKFGHVFELHEALMGGCAIDAAGVPLSDATIDICKNSDGVLLGAVGGAQWDFLPGHLRPEAGLLGLRAALGLYANLRPAALHPSLIGACPLRPELAEKGFDLVIVRELTGGIYFGERGRVGETAFDTEVYSAGEIERVGRVAFELAGKRNGRLCSVDKANVLESSRLWREVMHRLRDEYPGVEYSDMLVDNAAMQLIRDPRWFDVLVTSNMFGDILSDEAGMLTGSIGLLASASLGAGPLGLYEPVHGSAPDIAGQDRANPIAAILSAAMLLRLSLGLDEEALSVENAVTSVLENGYRTADIWSGGCKLVGTREMGRLIAGWIT